MPVELDTAFLGLQLDEEMLKEEFDAIIGAGWSTSRDQPRRLPAGPRSPALVGAHPDGRASVVAELFLGTRLRGGGIPREAPIRERGPPKTG